MNIRKVADLPFDPIQTDPLRRLVNVWRAQAHKVYGPVQEALYEVADELTALLNERDRLPLQRPFTSKEFGK